MRPLMVVGGCEPADFQARVACLFRTIPTPPVEELSTWMKISWLFTTCTLLLVSFQEAFT